MQKEVKLPDGRSIFINVERPIWNTEDAHPRPNLHIIYDLNKPAAKNYTLHVSSGHIFLRLEEAGEDLPISGETFLELLHPTFFYPKKFTREAVGVIYAELLSLLWQCQDRGDDEEYDE